MKSFLEEYGLMIVAVIVVAALILLGTKLSQNGTEGMTNTFESFQKTASEAVANPSGGAGGELGDT